MLRTNGSGLAVLVGPGTRRGSHTGCYLRRRQWGHVRAQEDMSEETHSAYSGCVRDQNATHIVFFFLGFSTKNGRSDDGEWNVLWYRVPLGGQS